MQEDLKSAAIRIKIFEWLKQKAIEYDDVIPHKVLNHDFTLEGERVPLIGPQGIFKPKIISYYPISITTSPNSPYADKITGNELFYKYRGENPQHPENLRLKMAMKFQIPLVYFHGVMKGYYVPQFPVYITHDNDRNLTFTVLADSQSAYIGNQAAEQIVHYKVEDEIRRRYVTSEVVIRLHQRSFREKVLRAYREHCAFCKLKHRELLDAAHIIPDNEGGEPIVPNGISLCKIHHAAYDKNILGINEDYRIEVRQDILDEVDGPMLKYGLQELQHKTMVLPRSANMQPNKDFIRDRYEKFLKVV